METLWIRFPALTRLPTAPTLHSLTFDLISDTVATWLAIFLDVAADLSQSAVQACSRRSFNGAPVGEMVGHRSRSSSVC
jgi:hypothetical protein